MSEVEIVIMRRANLQSIEHDLERKFGVRSLSLVYLKSNKFKGEFPKWDKSKQNSFYVTLGGRANFNNTKRYLEGIMES